MGYEAARGVAVNQISPGLAIATETRLMCVTITKKLRDKFAMLNISAERTELQALCMTLNVRIYQCNAATQVLSV